jgi:hypothetical protein
MTRDLEELEKRLKEMTVYAIKPSERIGAENNWVVEMHADDATLVINGALELLEERRRLRGALKEIAEWGCDLDTKAACNVAQIAMARQALSGEAQAGEGEA